MKRLDEIEARANAATEGPWEAFIDRIDHPGKSVFAVAYDVGCDADTEFIAHAREDVPALVAALRAVLELHACIEPSLEQEREEGMRDWCGECDTFWPCPTVTAIHQHLGEDD